LALAALTGVYYLRFWFAYDPSRAGHETPGAALDFFDSVVASVEFAAAALVYAWDARRGRGWL
jgi:hypothetical protein